MMEDTTDISPKKTNLEPQNGGLVDELGEVPFHFEMMLTYQGWLPEE